jgi:ubiquinone/menaquinone biosynthesis C-methylase UbiE
MGKMRRFLRKPTRTYEPLAVAMSGARMGERILQIGVNDPAIAGALAAKAGLSGHAAIAVTSDAAAERARRGAANAAALVDVAVTTLQTLPFAPDEFDVIVVHSADALLASLDAAVRRDALRECHRVLRRGGRILVIEAQAPRGLKRLVHPGRRPDPAYDSAGGSTAALEAAGFKAVRLLVAREGFQFFEGLKG